MALRFLHLSSSFYPLLVETCLRLVGTIISIDERDVDTARRISLSTNYIPSQPPNSLFSQKNL